MTTSATAEHRSFEADVSRLLHMMVHSVYSDRDVFLRELISNAADACEKLRYEAITQSVLLGEEPKLAITIEADAEAGRLVIADNGIGMSRDEMVEALGTIARSGTRTFMERITATEGKDGARLIGQFGVGFYSAFMVAGEVGVVSRRAGSDEAWAWSSDGKGEFTVAPVALEEAPARGTRVTLHLMGRRQELCRALDAGAHRQGAVRPRAGADRPGREAWGGADHARRRCRTLDQAEERDLQGGLRRLLSQRRRAI